MNIRVYTEIHFLTKETLHQKYRLTKETLHKIGHGIISAVILSLPLIQIRQLSETYVQLELVNG